MLFESLNKSHAYQILAFELENREFFESVIAPREEIFYSLAGVLEHIENLLTLNSQSFIYPYVLVQNGSIIARANIKEMQSGGVAEIGYRVGKTHAGKGVGSLCVAHLVNTGINLGLKQLSAFVINNNPASEKVLLKNGFRLNLCIPNGFVHQGRLFHGFNYRRELA